MPQRHCAASSNGTSPRSGPWRTTSWPSLLSLAIQRRPSSSRRRAAGDATAVRQLCGSTAKVSTVQGDRPPSRSIPQRRALLDPGWPVRASPSCPRPEPARPLHLLRRGALVGRPAQRHRSPSRVVHAGLHERLRHRPALGCAAAVGRSGSTAIRPDPFNTPHRPVADG